MESASRTIYVSWYNYEEQNQYRSLLLSCFRYLFFFLPIFLVIVVGRNFDGDKNKKLICKSRSVDGDTASCVFSLLLSCLSMTESNSLSQRLIKFQSIYCRNKSIPFSIQRYFVGFREATAPGREVNILQFFKLKILCLRVKLKISCAYELKILILFQNFLRCVLNRQLRPKHVIYKGLHSSGIAPSRTGTGKVAVVSSVRYHPGICLMKLTKILQNSSQDGRQWDLNPLSSQSLASQLLIRTLQQH